MGREPFRGVSYDGLNKVLASEARRHDNLIVVDWETKIIERPEWLAPDGTHLTPEGYRARARETTRAVRSC